jgi:hypothetical protein
MRETGMFPAACVLDTWSEHEWQQGVQVGTLPDFSDIVVQTQNTRYELTVIDGNSREVLIRGGRYFPEQTAARLAGSSLRGSFLKVGGIYIGFGMEIVIPGMSVVTSPVQSIRICA